jgi:hypothetical protein
MPSRQPSKERLPMMSKDFREILQAFNAHGVRYLVVGGFAFGAYSEPRTTKDIDLWIRTDPENAKAVFAALAEFGAPIAGMGPADFTDGTMFHFGQPPNRVDILQKIDGVSFDDAWANRVEGSIEGAVPSQIISRDDLIRNKLASGREQDLLDVKVLRAAEKAVRSGSAQSKNPGT